MTLPLRILVIAVALLSGLPTASRAHEGSASGVVATPILKATTDVAGATLAYPKEGQAELSGVLVELAPGAQTGWHHHVAPAIGYILEGEVCVEQEGGARRTFKAGECFAEMVNRPHCGTNPGTKPCRILLFVAGAAGQPVSVKEPRGQ